MAEEYNFPFSEKSVYAHVRDLLLSFHQEGGVVLDLGCGYGALAEVLVSPGLPGLVLRAVSEPGRARSKVTDDLLESLRSALQLAPEAGEVS